MISLGIDIGTTTISFALYDSEDRNVLAAYTVANDSAIDSIRSWERIQSPERIVRIVSEQLQVIFTEHPEVNIEGIGLTGQMHGIVITDEHGIAVSPLYTWQDQRGELIEGDATLTQRIKDTTGIQVSTGYGLVTSIWLMDHDMFPENGRKICTIMDYVGMRLTGRTEPLVHASNAAGFGFWNARTGEFLTDILRKIGVDTRILPETTKRRRSIGMYKGIPVCTAIGDNQASFLAATAGADGSFLINLGTGGQISMVTGEMLLNDRSGTLEVRPYIGRKFLIVGSSLCGGRAYAILKDFFAKIRPDLSEEELYAYMEEEGRKAKYAPPLQVDTSFMGTRGEPEKRGSITGLSPDNFTPGALVIGVLNGMLDELKEMYEQALQVQKNITVPVLMIGSGNAIRKNRLLQELAEEKFGKKLLISKNEEEAACGAAMCCMAIKERVGG